MGLGRRGLLPADVKLVRGRGSPRWNRLVEGVAHLQAKQQGSAMLDRRYESAPVCAKPSYWMRRDGSEFITNSLGNGRPSLNRFVLDKCHLWMNYDMWFSTFSGSLHSA